MSTISAMTVHLQTAGSPAGAGTSSLLYLGLVGRAGGREFAISGPGENILDRYGHPRLPPLRPGEPMRFRAGRVPLDAVRPGDIGLGPEGLWLLGAATPGLHIGLEETDYVYLRKAARGRNDDTWFMDWAIVTLYAEEAPPPELLPGDDYEGPGEYDQRTFYKAGPVALGAAFGLRVYLEEWFEEGVPAFPIGEVGRPVNG